MDDQTIDAVLQKAWDAWSIMPTTLHMPLPVYRALRCGFRAGLGHKPTGTLRQRKRMVSYRRRLTIL